jgi:hypothetical protein
VHEAGDGLLEELALPEDLAELSGDLDRSRTTALRGASQAEGGDVVPRTPEEEGDRRREDGRQRQRG